MRVAYLTNHYPKVSHSFIRREILALERAGIDVMRISLRGWDSDLADTADHAERERTRYVLRDGATPLLVACIRMLIARPRRFIQAFRLAWTMSRNSERPFPIHLVYLLEACQICFWLRGQNIEHLHVHFGTNPAEVAMLVHALGGPRWSLTVHGPEEFDRAPLIGLSKKILDCAFAVAISSYGRGQIYRWLDYRYWSKVHVVHCGLEPSFHEGVQSLANPVRRLICVGRLCDEKGQLLLIEAAWRLSEIGITFELVLAGDGEARLDIEALIDRYKLRPCVRITGWISGEQVREEILSARALVLASFAEGLPVVLMEAMALRRPVISTMVAGIPELVIQNENGWLVPAGDVDALAAAMRECLDAPVEILSRMGEGAHHRALDRHSIDVEAAKLAALYRQATFTAKIAPSV